MVRRDGKVQKQMRTFGTTARELVGLREWLLSEGCTHVYRRSGYLEERYLTASFNPIVLDSGKVGGSFSLIDDTTDRVIGERRLRTLRDLAARSMEAKELDEACRVAAAVMSDNRYDLPFALFYLPDEDRKRAKLV